LVRREGLSVTGLLGFTLDRVSLGRRLAFIFLLKPPARLLRDHHLFLSRWIKIFFLGCPTAGVIGKLTKSVKVFELLKHAGLMGQTPHAAASFDLGPQFSIVIGEILDLIERLLGDRQHQRISGSLYRRVLQGTSELLEAGSVQAEVFPDEFLLRTARVQRGTSALRDRIFAYFALRGMVIGLGTRVKGPGGPVVV
jgi:hypothetical protein